ncbi:hypothetical protein C8J57DRAFT_1294788 [Mycena rebaudengoi]|nr:hypothetical protein C8J57DRAFT_1404899 [Mycena rebaudengoi]KAJ7284191.1 hypothetical protein C8J57DRAFT_1294788 [Mycena rebaudengoi]
MWLTARLVLSTTTMGEFSGDVEVDSRPGWGTLSRVKLRQGLKNSRRRPTLAEDLNRFRRVRSRLAGSGWLFCLRLQDYVGGTLRRPGASEPVEETQRFAGPNG